MVCRRVLLLGFVPGWSQRMFGQLEMEVPSKLICREHVYLQRAEVWAAKFKAVEKTQTLGIVCSVHVYIPTRALLTQ